MSIQHIEVTRRSLTLYHGTNLGSVKSIVKTGLGIDINYYMSRIIKPIASLFKVDPTKLLELAIPKSSVDAHSEYRGSVSFTSEFNSNFFGSYLTDVLAKGGEFRNHVFWSAVRLASRITGRRFNRRSPESDILLLERKIFGSPVPVIVEALVPYSKVANPEDYGTSSEIFTKGPIGPESIIAVYSPAPSKDRAKIYWSRS